MKKLCLMFVGAIFAFQTIAVAQTTPTKKKKKTTTSTASTKTPVQEYSTSERSGVNSYAAATDSVALGQADSIVPVKVKTVKKTSKKTTTHVKPN